jgi:hypothetical protein
VDILGGECQLSNVIIIKSLFKIPPNHHFLLIIHFHVVARRLFSAAKLRSERLVRMNNYSKTDKCGDLEQALNLYTDFFLL